MLISLCCAVVCSQLPLTAAAALLLSSGVETNNHSSAAEVSEIPGQVRVQTLKREKHLHFLFCDDITTFKLFDFFICTFNKMPKNGKHERIKRIKNRWTSYQDVSLKKESMTEIRFD